MNYLLGKFFVGENDEIFKKIIKMFSPIRYFIHVSFFELKPQGSYERLGIIRLTRG